MILNLIVVALVLFIAYMWASQGLFSAVIHMMCTIVAGAVAFGVWETVVSSFLLGFREDIAWSLGLGLPFLITLLVLRIAADKLIPANLDFDDTTNLVGGGVFGLVSGVIATGILVIAIGFLRLPPDFLGYQGIQYDPQGSLVRGSSLWIPADKITAKLYERLSIAGFATETPMALRQPDVQDQAAAIRVTFNGSSRTTLSRSDFEVVGRYSVTGESGGLLTDSFTVDKEGGPIPQNAKSIDGQPIAASAAGEKLEGLVLKFNSGAKEKSGQIVVGPGQIRLICSKDGEAFGVHPVAVIAQAAGDQRVFGRFRFDAQDVYVASVGGASDSLMAFEFPIPPGATPVDLLVKNIRVPFDEVRELAGAPKQGYTPLSRDDAIHNLSLLGLTPSAASAAPDAAPTRTPPPLANQQGSGIEQNNQLPMAFNKSERGALDIDEDNKISDGHHKLARSQFRGDIPRQLKVQEFATTKDTTMVQVDVSLTSKLSLLGQSVQTAESVAPPVIVDTLGQRYEAVGWIFEETESIDVRYQRGDPVRGLSQIPSLSRSRPDQKLKLLFIVSKGVSIKSFNLGERVIQEFNPPFSLSG